MNIPEKLKEDYKVKEENVKKEAARELALFLEINLEDVDAYDSFPTKNGIIVYLKVGELLFRYTFPEKIIEFRQDNGEHQIVKEKADVGRLLVLKEIKDKN